MIQSNGVVYKDEPWHKECFICTECHTQLSNSPFLVRDEKPYCKPCYGNLFSNKCEACNTPITGKLNLLSIFAWLDFFIPQTNYHAWFMALMEGGKRGREKILMQFPTDFTPTQQHNKQMLKCMFYVSTMLTGANGTKYITYEDRYWHTQCFACHDCQTKLEGRGFIKDGINIICGECAKIKLSSIWEKRSKERKSKHTGHTHTLNTSSIEIKHCFTLLLP